MNVINQLHPEPAQAMRFFSTADDGPICMVNLLKFRDKAAYADGSEPDLSGQEAYMRYGDAVGACVEAVGGTVRFSATVSDILLGEVEELWDMVAIAQYPSRMAMMQMVQSPAYQAIAHHRDAGLAGQLNIATKAVNE